MGTQPFRVVETTSLPLQQQILIKELEISSLSNLIARRDVWLNKPENQNRNTFGAISNDTRLKRDRLVKYMNELAKLNQISKGL